MALWRPPTMMSERTARAVRSMQNGSMDGRIVSARPAKPRGFGDEAPDFTDGTEDISEDDNLDLLPWTDKFVPRQIDVGGKDRVERGIQKIFTLTHLPYRQSEMDPTPIDPSKASVIVYWNNVIQREGTYTLHGKNIIFHDSYLKEFGIKPYDEFTVKYWYNSTSPDQEIVSKIPMEVWLTWAGPQSVEGDVLNFWQSGLVSGPPLGTNLPSGAFTEVFRWFVTLSYGGGRKASYSFRLPSNVPNIPVEGVRIDWYASWDSACTLYIERTHFGGKPEYPPLRDTTTNKLMVDPKARVKQKPNSKGGRELILEKKCGIGGEATQDAKTFSPSDFKGSLDEGVFDPRPGPEAGKRIFTGTKALSLANKLNKDRKIDFEIQFTPSGYVSGCSCMIFETVCLDGSIWGSVYRGYYAYESFTGVTAYITPIEFVNQDSTLIFDDQDDIDYG